ncbi:MAG: pyrroline-5-carboxylate reductase dimerization domain-containing protein [Bacteriovorax sp.]|jgi:pyrroline-5-carboxylate reductase
MAKLKIGVFGCGNMGAALVLGMHTRFPEAEFFLFTPSHTKAEVLAQKVGGTSLINCADMPVDLDWYLLGFKPQSLDEFEFNFSSGSKIISVLAGVKISKLISKFNVLKIARLMPNTPSAISLGANLLYLNEDFKRDEIEELNSLISSTGTIFPMASEKDLDLTTAFSGSGPALIFELARIFEAELSRMTEGRVPAKEIIAKTFLGSSALMNAKMETASFEELRHQVTSKKGVTYEALEVLKENKMQNIFANAFEAAYKRTVELSNN